jgi:hypothetical protein
MVGRRRGLRIQEDTMPPRTLRALALCVTLALSAHVQTAGAAALSQGYAPAEIVAAGHRVFGNVAGDLATMVERLVARYGLPTGYVLGEEAGGAVLGGLRYGEGTLYTRAGSRRIFWQGPSLGFDLGGDGDRTMMLVYGLRPQAVGFGGRFAGLDGSAYLVGGLGMTVLASRDGEQTLAVVPIRSGVGARLGLNAGYLKFSDRPTWNPF